MDLNKHILTYCEVVNGLLSEGSKELLGCSRHLANRLAEKLVVVIVGNSSESAVQEAITFGADEVIIASETCLRDFRSDVYVALMTEIINTINPRIILFCHSSTTLDIAPRLAFRLGTSVVMDCVELVIDEAKKVLQRTKPIYGGNVYAVYSDETVPQLAVIRPKSMKMPQPDPSRTGVRIDFQSKLEFDGFQTKVIQTSNDKSDGRKLEAAGFVIGGGRGIGGADAFSLLEELASKFGGSAGATRAVCDNEWAAPSRQIGLTGCVIAPDLYIAVAVSGAAQHMAGCHGAGTIVAINTDEGANIFKDSQYGVVGDWREVLPAFIDKCLELTE